MTSYDSAMLAAIALSELDTPVEFQPVTAQDLAAGLTLSMIGELEEMRVDKLDDDTEACVQAVKRLWEEDENPAEDYTTPSRRPFSFVQPVSPKKLRVSLEEEEDAKDLAAWAEDQLVEIHVVDLTEEEEALDEAEASAAQPEPAAKPVLAWKHAPPTFDLDIDLFDKLNTSSVSQASTVYADGGEPMDIDAEPIDLTDD